MDIFVTVNKKSIRTSITGRDAEEYTSRVRNAMFVQDRKIKEEEADRKKRGACPKCHLTLPLSKYCWKCGNTY